MTSIYSRSKKLVGPFVAFFQRMAFFVDCFNDLTSSSCSVLNLLIRRCLPGSAHCQGYGAVKQVKAITGEELRVKSPNAQRTSWSLLSTEPSILEQPTV